MAFKAAGNPCDVFREHVVLNNASFAGAPTYPDTSDWELTSGRWGLSPARVAPIGAGGGYTSPQVPSLVLDATDYATNPIEGSWYCRLHGSGSPANTNGSQRGGNMT